MQLWQRKYHKEPILVDDQNTGCSTYIWPLKILFWPDIPLRILLTMSTLFESPTSFAWTNIQKMSESKEVAIHFDIR